MREVGSDAGDGVAAVTQPTDKVRWDRDGAGRGVALDAGGDAVFLREAGGFPAHAKGEGWVVSGFFGEEVEEVPLRHEGDEAGVDGEVGEVGDGELLAAYVGGELGDLGVREGEEFVRGLARRGFRAWRDGWCRRGSRGRSRCAFRGR